MKRKHLLIIVLILQFNFVKAQQIPQFTHHLMNQFAYNPAVAGSKNCMDLTMAHRRQWSGLEGAPVTTFASFHTVIKKSRFSLAKKHAIGLVFLNDNYGPYDRMKLKVAYSYHMPVTRKVLLSMGMFLGVEQFHFDARDVTLINYADPAIYNSGRKTIVPEITPGIFLQSNLWFIGATLQQTLGHKVKAIGTDESRLARHATLLGGLNVKLNRKWGVVPSVLFKMISSAPVAVDVNVMATYKNNLSFGLSYRNVDAASVLVKYSFLNYLTLGYAFDYTLSDIQIGSSNTHEVTIGINPCGYKKAGKYACPTFN